MKTSFCPRMPMADKDPTLEFLEREKALLKEVGDDIEFDEELQPEQPAEVKIAAPSAETPLGSLSKEYLQSECALESSRVSPVMSSSSLLNPAESEAQSLVRAQFEETVRQRDRKENELRLQVEERAKKDLKTFLDEYQTLIETNRLKLAKIDDQEPGLASSPVDRSSTWQLVLQKSEKFRQVQGNERMKEIIQSLIEERQ